MLYAAYLLRGTLKEWWDNQLEVEGDFFSQDWEEFLILFKKEFMPEQWQKNKRVEFINIR